MMGAFVRGHGASLARVRASVMSQWLVTKWCACRAAYVLRTMDRAVAPAEFRLYNRKSDLTLGKAPWRHDPSAKRPGPIVPARRSAAWCALKFRPARGTPA